METLAQPWLIQLCRIIRGLSRAIVLLDKPGGDLSQPAACLPGGSNAPPALLAAARSALADRRCVVRCGQSLEQAGTGQLDIIASPLQIRQEIIGSVAVAVDSQPDADLRAFLQLLQWGCEWFQLLVDRQAAVSPEPLPDVRDALVFRQEQMSRAGRERLEEDLQQAMRNDELELFYQPVTRLKTGAVVSLEALLRWRHPDFGLIPPKYFIPLAESSGLMTDIGAWVLQTACRQLRQWQENGFEYLCVSVNLSAVQIRQYDLPAIIGDTLERAGVSPLHLELEVTENTIMENIDTAPDALHVLHKSGVRISIDDFGTGYSSLNHLGYFPISRIKLDRSLLHEITRDPDHAGIIRTIITLAHDMGLGVVAEGVENAEQLACLRELGCDDVQGYLLSPPVPATEVESLLRENRDRGAAVSYRTRAAS